MEKPDELADREFLSAEEAARLEQETLARNEELANRPALRTSVTESVDSGENGAPGFYNNFWLDRGTTTVGTRRTSLVVDPPNGRMPPLTPEAEAKQAVLRAAREGVVTHAPTPGGFVEDFGSNGLQLRCITGFNSGPPMTPGGYNNNVQIFQTPDTVALLAETPGRHGGRCRSGCRLVHGVSVQPRRHAAQPCLIPLATTCSARTVAALTNLPVRVWSPEERELERKRSELTALEAELIEQELRLSTLEAELAAFQTQYLRVVGVRYAELDDLEDSDRYNFANWRDVPGP
ncbi:MAG: hypothetical protein J4G16_12120 [Acidobacteria bacterium]|nr:hypothetical protein [Acidobacteriota bacterium]